MLRFSKLKISVKNKISEELLKDILQKKLKTKINSVRIARLSIDARDKTDVVYDLSVDFTAENEKRLLKNRNVSKIKSVQYIIEQKKSDKRPVVVGFGPAGMMAGLYFAEAGLRPIVVERGRSARQRMEDVKRFWETGVLDTSSNVQFGEGGAGTFSDGKLNTGVNDVRIGYIFKKFVEFGAPKEILYMSKPHIGTDKLIDMVGNIRKRIEALGGEVLFETKLTEIDQKDGEIKGVCCGERYIETDTVILAVGHSARDTFKMLYDMGLPMERKPFAVGVRVEHSQDFINKSRYGEFAAYLSAADYKLSTHLEDGRGVFSFCMCPGGYVVAASSEEGGVVTNGMSYSKRDGKNSNSAVLVGIGVDDLAGDDVLEGVRFQRELERKAYALGGSGYKAPVQNVSELIAGKGSDTLVGVSPTYRPGVTPSDFRELFPAFLYESLRQGLINFDRSIKGFASEGAIATAVESRSSSPVRLIRDRESLECLCLKGLYPCGEGAGYAGGIVSAAVDGLKCAEKAAGRF